MSHLTILSQAENHVRKLYTSKLPSWRTFHGIRHTEEVVRYAQDLARFYDLDEEENMILLVAAWFHDTGYCFGDDHHERESVRLANAFTFRLQIGNAVSERIADLILATRFPPSPATLMEQILCDCDLHHLASFDYQDWSTQLKTELEHQNNQKYSADKWNGDNIEFFRNHQYFTDYAKMYWEEQKESNLSSLLAIYNSSSSR
jgi:predicted metal-dependent HD superfamily phosphohydrolase